MNLCHNEATKARIKYKKEQNAAVVEPNGIYLITYQEQLFDRIVAEGIREIDAKAAEIDYIIFAILREVDVY